jgi:hypothetical protein
MARRWGATARVARRGATPTVAGAMKASVAAKEASAASAATDFFTMAMKLLTLKGDLL